MTIEKIKPDAETKMKILKNRSEKLALIAVSGSTLICALTGIIYTINGK